MNPQLSLLARQTFMEALDPGPSEQPGALERILTQIRSAADRPPLWDLEMLGWELQHEFAFRGDPPEITEISRWMEAVRWVLDALRNWDSRTSHALQELQAFLVAVGNLDAGSAGIEAVASQLATPELISGLQRLINSGEICAFGISQGNLRRLREEFATTSRHRNYEQMHRQLRYMMPSAQTDLRVAIVLLWQLGPRELANLIATKDDVLFSATVCHVLGGCAVNFAMQVTLVSFKFVSVSYLLREDQSVCTNYDRVDLLQQLLLQVAQTPDWAGWMRAFFKYPDSQSLIGQALPKVLADLDEKHWEGFIAAFSLEYSGRAAAPVADILTRFTRDVGVDKAKMMWSITFRRWDDWNYGNGEKNSFLSSPVACALDYPVSMYYALLPTRELNHEEAKLSQKVESVELQWFASESDLITERNRLLSRLRLVRHGRTLVNGGPLLPSPPQPDDALYYQIRYHYHEV